MQVPAARPVRRRAREPARDGRREAAVGPRPAVPQLALHPVHLERQRRGDGPARGSSPAEIGVDRLCWEITDHPEDAFSRRFVPGSPALDAIRHEIWDDNNLGNAIPGATPRARIDVRTLVPGPAADRARPAGRCSVRTRVHNLSTRAVPGAGDLRPAARPARRAAVRRRRHADQPRLRARRGCRRRSAPGEPADVAIELPAPRRARALRAEVRSGQRRHGLVRALRIGDDDEEARG